MDRTQLLVRKAKRGDTDAYGELIRIHKDYFYRNAFCYVKNPEGTVPENAACTVKSRFRKMSNG